jgi:hypothetical protein
MERKKGTRMVDPTTTGGALAAQVIQALPPNIQSLITKPGKTSERIKAAIRWAARPDPAVVRRHQRRNAAVQTFEDIQKAELHDMDAVARQIARLFRRRAALTGAATGLPGGLWAVVAAGADVQLTAIYAVRMVADIAQAYGYNTSLLDEQAELADVLAIAAGVDSLRGVGTWLTRNELTHLIPDLLPRLLTRLSVRITEEQAGKWAGRIIPGLGAVVSGAIDYTFLRVAGNRAREHYHNRFAHEQGMDGKSLPAPTASAALLPAAPTEMPAALAEASAASAAMSADATPPVAQYLTGALAPTPPEDAPQRSGALAALLELLVPGAGAFYTGRTGVAALWFLVSLAALYIAGLQLSGPLTALSQGQSVDLATLPGWAPYFAGAALLWLVLRVVLAVRYAQTYATLHANRPPERNFAAQLATFAFFALVATIGACAALGYIVYSAIASAIH